MTVSRLRLRLPKSESRLMVERECERIRRYEVEAWRMSDSRFFTAFVVLCAAIIVAVLALR
jgi:hypothetical protein